MKSLTEVMIEVLLMFGKVFGKKTNEEIKDLVPIWLAIVDMEGITPAGLQAAAMEVLKTHTDYWPKPAHLRAALTPFAGSERDRRFSESFKANNRPVLEMADKPLTPEGRKAILASMRPEARALLTSILSEDERATSLQVDTGFKRLGK